MNVVPDLHPTELGGDEAKPERPRRGELHGADDPWGYHDARTRRQQRHDREESRRRDPRP